MATWYHGSIGYQKEDEAGALKVIQEQYLVDAISHTEAEARLHKQIVTGATDFEVKRIVPMKLADLFAFEEGEQWFKTKVIYFSVDEKSGKEKKVVNYMLVNADNIEHAMGRIKESMKNFLIPYDIEAITLTKILDVFPYRSDEESCQ